MQTTTNYAMKKIDLTDSPPDITALNGNFDTIDEELKNHDDLIANMPKYQTAGGTATAIILTDFSLVDGFSKNFIINTSNNGVATTINGKPLYKPGTTAAPKLTAGKAATVWYNAAGDCFFIKASAEGDAVVGDVLAGKIFSNDDDTGLVGTLSLTGNATAAQVKSGYTFYNTDAKTKLTGTNTDKKFASGTGTVSSGLLEFTLTNGTATYSSYYVEVTGLSFLPSTIVIIADSGSSEENVTVFRASGATVSNSAFFARYSASGLYTDKKTAIAKGKTAPAYVTSSGFLLPLMWALSGSTFSWYAVE
ncbi:putative phage tail fiber protein [Peptoclostridium acidaminophilum DSM 3953]|uniref:Putative phage tail fiber protein n=1 Tax=Peptoclostridium acidaminophilum DSM 3953 TaxID=1286171 RepID=W8U673_PEPAC|nr:hypothetical protein [Peptoclostridium acidaminophilum]AHM56421.1 putative phage tail fiber protein [Peptoclostridium acidaminophilum DSM 3953]